MNWIKKHRCFVIIVTIAMIFGWPLVVNSFYSIETKCEILHEPSGWTMFWGSYIGSIVSAAVAFIILHLQRKDNRKENESNRILQLKILEHQQEMQWLNTFRKVCSEYVVAYSNNDIRYVINTMVNDPKEAFECIKILIERLKKCDIALKYIGFRGNSTKILCTCDSLFNLYMQALNDIQNEVVYLMQNKLSSFQVFSEISNSMEISDEMKLVIQDYTRKLQTDNISDITHFHTIALLRISKLEMYINEIQNALGNYIHSEQDRIEQILKQDTK